MIERVATCRCGQLAVACDGDPVRVSVCHCLDCQRRSGSAFAVQARFPIGRVRMTGAMTEWSAAGEGAALAVFRFCPVCGSTVAYTSEAVPEMIAVAISAFADPAFPAPTVSGYEERRHDWVAITGDDVEHFD